MALVPIKAGLWQPDASHSFRHKVGKAATPSEKERDRGSGHRQNREESRGMAPAAAKTTRKGPWTEQEDLQLVWFVRLFGERRWDFLAKVSGLNRTGKSCRLRWVNYLHPGLKHGRMTPQEERLVLQLHAKWGNRWSRIARKLPGRTDNEIKNYWRTLMRKKAQERNGNAISSSSPSSSSTSSNAASHGIGSIPAGNSLYLSEVKGYTTDQIWNEIAASDSVSNLTFEEYKGGSGCSCMVGTPVASPIWEACESLWRIDTEDMTTMTSMPDFFESYCSKQRIDSQKH
ncbi:myb-related protein MYBAS1-like [Zingiber officinale]|uniref:MYB protein n=1 Tax=Zingiber officinale TaxID=94328 RepID=A0A8J5HII6_ZINOF|nr:myb-related protein MYBAS1-like [Zingiber officinale]KAG6527818.1 hypothetical protein ZIOFF_009952 [Zingiber officinale]WLQ69625.1 MYB protein [Zingiber officinale]